MSRKCSAVATAVAPHRVPGTKPNVVLGLDVHQRTPVRKVRQWANVVKTTAAEAGADVPVSRDISQNSEEYPVLRTHYSGYNGQVTSSPLALLDAGAEHLLNKDQVATSRVAVQRNKAGPNENHVCLKATRPIAMCTGEFVHGQALTMTVGIIGVRKRAISCMIRYASYPLLKTSEM